MKIYLGGSVDKTAKQKMRKLGLLFLLQTFYDMDRMNDSNVVELLNLPRKGFMLDSGAFTFMNSGKVVNWKEYINKYVDFINKWGIKTYIELDLYGILGVDKTEKIRKRLENETGIKPIPVYHGTMPVSYYRMLCQNYPYVAISATGTIESSKWTRNRKALKQVIKIGHSYGAKLHGLGYTRLDNLNAQEIQFDSVDSSSWLYGARYGIAYKIKHSKIIQVNAKDYITGIRRTYEEWENLNIPPWIQKQKELYKGE